MNLWHTIVVKVGHVVAAVFLMVGLAQPVQSPQTTTVDIDPITSQATISGATVAQPIPAETLPSVKQTPTPNPAPTPEPVSAPTPESPSILPTPVPVPVFVVPIPAFTPDPTPAPIISQPAIIQPTPMTYNLEIISPIGGKGLGRTYKVSPTYPNLEDESNYIELGVILRDDAGNIINDASVTITATDQDPKVLNGTGDVTPIYPNGDKQFVHFYAFHYEFQTPGEKTITFEAKGVSQSVTINVE